jgi:transposase
VTNLHLAEISAQVAPGSIAALICDGAGWNQRGGEIRLPDNIVLLPLPPYAPELNPMKNVWDYLRAAQRIKSLCGAKPPQRLRWTNAGD